MTSRTAAKMGSRAKMTSRVARSVGGEGGEGGDGRFDWKAAGLRKEL